MEQASANLSSSLEKAKGANAGDKMLRIAKKGAEVQARIDDCSEMNTDKFLAFSRVACATFWLYNTLNLLSTEERKELERVSRLEAAINAVYVAAKEARDASA